MAIWPNSFDASLKCPKLFYWRSPDSTMNFKSKQVDCPQTWLYHTGRSGVCIKFQARTACCWSWATCYKAGSRQPPCSWPRAQLYSIGWYTSKAVQRTLCNCFAEKEHFKAHRYENDGLKNFIRGPVPKPDVQDEEIRNVARDLILPSCPVICHGLVGAPQLRVMWEIFLNAMIMTRV